MLPIDFVGFEKIARLNREVIVTEKIDGTNAQVHIRPLAGEPLELGYDTQIEVNGIPCAIRAGSRNRGVLRDHVVPNPMLHGIFHVGGESISKYDLLREIHTQYGVSSVLSKDEEPRINRSLNSNRFQLCTGYKPPGWQQMIKEMHDAHA